MTVPDLATPRRLIRKRAFANLMVVLLAQARRTGGRLTVLPYAPCAMMLFYRDVRTLVRREGAFALGLRDFELVLNAPPLWPFDRQAALQPFVCRPDDYAAPNSDGHGLCLDLEGIRPERLPGVLYDTLRLARYRLDDVVSRKTADFVRSQLQIFPADTRPLYASDDTP